MSSDSSDDENLDLLREATDSQFINDSMFNEKTSNPVINKTVSSSKETLPSLRKAKDEDEQFNLFRVTPGFRNYVAKHLSKSLEEKIRKKIVTNVNETNNQPKKCRQKYGVKLLSASQRFLKVGEKNSVNKSNIQLTPSVRPSRNYKLARIYREVNKDLLRQVAVAPEDILSQKDTKYWSNRSKAPVFYYKKSADGQLVLVPPEFN